MHGKIGTDMMVVVVPILLLFLVGASRCDGSSEHNMGSGSNMTDEWINGGSRDISNDSNSSLTTESLTMSSTLLSSGSTSPSFNSSTSHSPSTFSPTSVLVLPTSSLPTSSLPTSSLPTSFLSPFSLPTFSLPTSSIPTSSIPTSSIPTSSIPTSSIPTSSIPTSSLPLISTPTYTAPTMEPTSILTLSLTLTLGVTGVILLVLLLIFLGCVCYCCYLKKSIRKKPQVSSMMDYSNDCLVNSYQMKEISSNKQPSTVSRESKEPPSVNRDLFAHIPKLASIPLEQFPAYVSSLHEYENGGAEDEYQYVKAQDYPVSKTNASLPCNEMKNRYINIMADDETRVVLSEVVKAPGADYINANYITGYNSPKEYIATQGPLPNTTVDFWQMAWEQNVHIIVMVTNVVEGGVIKCNEYWPKQGAIQYGQVVVTLEREKVFPEFIMRTFIIAHEQQKKESIESHEVIQFHFVVWPDFNVPQEASTMLKFVRHVRSHVCSDHGPMLVHCSAGVGRTGTFIAIDVMLQKMAKEEELNIQEFVCQMRAQRNHMVQTNGQYLFIYDALLHALVFGNMEVGVAQLKDHLTALSKPAEDEEEGETRLEREFNQVMLGPNPPTTSFSVAMRECNTAKNRNSNNVPLNVNRVVLDNAYSSPGGEYINASFVTGYYHHQEFIVTQHPLASTREDFWRMILERNIATIVTVGPVTDTSDNYWPSEGVMECGGVSVEKVTLEELEEGIVMRDFQVECAELETALPVSQYHLQEWPMEGAPLTPARMLALVEHSRHHWMKSGFGLIAVHTSCSLQTEASGLYCALCVLLRQMEVEGCVDVVTTLQRLREQRPGIFTSQDYFKFIYEVLALASTR